MNTEELARSVRDTAPGSIWIAGHSTRIPAPGRIDVVVAPRGIRSFTPDEMTVACGAGTHVDELLDVLSRSGQYVNLPVRATGSGTVGGALAVGEGDVMRLGRGSVRDVLLQADVVDGRGNVFRAGGPTVKNVSGFDVCRLLVGSCGRLGFVAEVILRTRPLPMACRWYLISEVAWADISHIMATVHRPTSVLWNGHDVRVCLEGHPKDLDDTRRALATALGRPVEESEAPDLRDHPEQVCHRVSDIVDVVTSSHSGSWAEVGTGVVHHRVGHRDVLDARPSDAIRSIETQLLESFDPDDRLNGGSAMWGTQHLRRLVIAT